MSKGVSNKSKRIKKSSNTHASTVVASSCRSSGWSSEQKRQFKKKLLALSEMTRGIMLSQQAVDMYIEALEEELTHEQAVRALYEWIKFAGVSFPMPKDIIGIARGVYPPQMARHLAEHEWKRFVSGVDPSRGSIAPELLRDRRIRKVIKLLGGWDEVLNQMKSGRIKDVKSKFVEAYLT